MLSTTTISSLALAFTGTASLTLAAPTSSSTNSTSEFSWGPCEFEVSDDNPFQIECSNFTAPLDYLDELSDKTINLQLARVPATNGESQGNIYFNFGGPGLEVRATLMSFAEQLLTITEGKYDLIGMDPRGVANTERFECYNETTRALVRPLLGLDEAYGPEDKIQLAHLWASSKNAINDCVATDESGPQIAELIGTGYAARDVIRVLDALEGEDALLNYWGISYGTVLGATVSAMYPDRVGRVLLDGNVNLPEWYDGYSLAWFRDADAAVLDFFERCVAAGPALCPLAALNQTALQLNSELYKVIHDLRLAPIPLGSPSVLDAATFRWILRLMLYGPTSWPVFAGALGQLLFVPESERNLTAIAELWGPVAASTGLSEVAPDESSYGIMCSDNNQRTEDFEDVFAVSGALRGVSASLGDVANTWTYPCAQWPWHAKGAYEGGWEAGAVETRNPLLFVGNTFDPVSSLANAYNASEIFTGAGVLEHRGIGHGFLNHPSLCTAKAVRAYFHEGKLPEEGVDCAADFDAFDSTKTWRDAYLPELGWE